MPQQVRFIPDEPEAIRFTPDEPDPTAAAPLSLADKIAKTKAGLSTQTQYNDTNPDSLGAKVAGFRSELQKSPVFSTLFPPAANPSTGHHDPFGVERGFVPVSAEPAVADAAAGVAKPVAGSLARRLYESALKPAPRANSIEEIRNMVDTGLKEGIPVSGGGLAKSEKIVNGLQQQVQDSIKSGAAQGATVDKFKVASRLNDAVKKFANQVNPESDLNAISESGNEFLANQPSSIPVDAAQALKQGTYQQLKDRAFGELKGGTVEAQKHLARGLKEEIEAQFPQVKDLNSRMGRNINLQGELGPAINRAQNRNILGFGTPMIAAGAELATGHPLAAVVTALAKEALTPGNKSRLAILLDRLAR